MRHSRYLCLLGITILCLFGFIALKTPHTVISALADSHYGESERMTVQHFWNLMDLRQTDLAQDLLDLQAGSSDDNEFRDWKTRLNKDPLLSLQKIEFINPELADEQTMIVRIVWISSVQQAEQVTFSFKLLQTEKTWHIVQFKQIN